jgi:hypothetical protein
MLDDARYAQYFGFTEQETDDLLDRAGLPKSAHDLKEMYNGYQIRDHVLYNPFSIISFINRALLLESHEIEEALKPYWINTGGTHLIGHLFRNNIVDLQSGFSGLVQEIPLETAINEHVIFNPNLKNNPMGFWSILLLSGYLKVAGRKADSRGRYTYSLLFPNEEIKRTMEEMLLEVAAGGMHRAGMYLLGMQSLLKKDIEYFTKFLKEYMHRVPSYFDTGEDAKEAYFHGFMIGMVTALWEHYHITSNRESGGGRYDISLAPKDKKGHGILIELKIASKKEDLQKEAQKAYNQIIGKSYKSDMEARGVKDFVFLGIAFCGKEVAVVSA